MRTRREIITVAATVLILLAGLVGGFFWSSSAFSGDPPQITLPSDDPANPGDGLSGSEIHPKNLQIYENLSLHSNNVGAVVNTLVRPANYSFEATTTIYYSGGKISRTHLCYVQGEYTKIELLNEAGMPRLHTIVGPLRIFQWEAGSASYSASNRGEFTADDLQYIPTYEMISRMAPELITVADYLIYNELPCIYVETSDPLTGYSDRYWISIETGLLIRAEKLDAADAVVYSMQTGQPAFEVSNELFRLPDGTFAQEE